MFWNLWCEGFTPQTAKSQSEIPECVLLHHLERDRGAKHSFQFVFGAGSEQNPLLAEAKRRAPRGPELRAEVAPLRRAVRGDLRSQPCGLRAQPNPRSGASARARQPTVQGAVRSASRDPSASTYFSFYKKIQCSCNQNQNT